VVSESRADLRSLVLALAAMGTVTVLYRALHVRNPTTVAVSFLLVVLLAAANARLWVAGLAAVVGMLTFNFFFIAPVGTFTVADPEDWAALVAFLVVSLVASNLSAASRARAASAMQRAQLLEERRSADVARQGEALQSALLASLAHDLKTPLTAIRIAADNLQANWLSPEQRREQTGIVLSEVKRLTRLFESILDMARIDGGRVAAARQWAHPLEIIEAARGQVEHFLRDHPIDVRDENTMLVELDPRLTAAALSHLLENAALYAPGGTAITVTASTSADGLLISVRDRGPGIPAEELPQLFDRFFRGRHARGTPGTGMGLVIARGLLALEGGQVSAGNDPDGGADFRIAVAARVRLPGVIEEAAAT
jgi:two-component system sensor histidine kinase KdpD